MRALVRRLLSFALLGGVLQFSACTDPVGPRTSPTSIRRMVACDPAAVSCDDPAQPAPIYSGLGVGLAADAFFSSPSEYGCPPVVNIRLPLGQGLARWTAPSGSYLYFTLPGPWSFQFDFFGYAPFNSGGHTWGWAVYRPGGSSEEETDPTTGDVYVQSGRILTRCWGNGQDVGVAVAREVWDPPVLVRSGQSSGGTGSGPCDSSNDFAVVFDPNAPSTSCGGSSGTGGDPGSGGTGGGTSCHAEEITIEVSYDGGSTWETVYSGSATVCE